MRKKIQITLIAPSSSQIANSSTMENLGLAYLASVLRKSGFTVDILDEALFLYPKEYIIENIINKKTRLLGVSLSSALFIEETKAIINEVRKKHSHCHISIGGYFATAYPEVLLELNADSLIYGEGDNAIVELANKLENNLDWKKINSIAYKNDNGELKINKCNSRIMNLDSLPFPSRDNLKYILSKGGVVAISSSRGCYGNCSFCLIQSNFTKQNGQKVWVGRSAQNVVDEVEYLINEYGVNEVWFMDPNFIGPKGIGTQRALEFCSELKKRNINISFTIECRIDDVLSNEELFKELWKVGLKRVYLGVESGVQRALNFYCKEVTVEDNKEAIKILKKLQFSIHVGFIFYDPHTTIDEIGENIKFIKEIGTDISIPGLGSNMLGLLYGTPITKRMVKEGIEPNFLGFGYMLKDKVRQIHLLFSKIVGRYDEFYQAERVSWRDIYILNSDLKGNEIVTKIRAIKNELILEILDDLLTYFVESTNIDNNELIELFKKLVDKYNLRIKELSNLLEFEKAYRVENNYYYDV